MSTLKVNSIQNTIGVDLLTPIQSGRAKAWVNFDGTFGSSPFTVSNGGIRNAFNVTSVTDNGTGDYTVTFDNAMPNANYIVAGTCKQNDSTSGGFIGIVIEGQTLANTYTTTSFRFSVLGLSSGNHFNAVVLNLVFFGD